MQGFSARFLRAALIAFWKKKLTSVMLKSILSKKWTKWNFSNDGMRPGSVEGSFAITKMNLRRNYSSYFSNFQFEPYSCSLQKKLKKTKMLEGQLTLRCWVSILFCPPPTLASSCFFWILCKTLPEQVLIIKAFFVKGSPFAPGVLVINLAETGKIALSSPPALQTVDIAISLRIRSGVRLTSGTVSVIQFEEYPSFLFGVRTSL